MPSDTAGAVFFEALRQTDTVLFVLDYLTSALINIAFAAASAIVLPLRYPKLFWVLEVAFMVPASCADLMDWPAELRLTCWVLNFVAVPFVCWRGPRAWRLVFSAALLLTETCGEVAFMVMFSLLGYSADELRSTTFVMASVTRILICGLVIVVSFLLRKQAARVTGEIPAAPLQWFGIFFTVQSVMMVCLIVQMVYSATIMDGWAMTGTLVSVAAAALSLVVSAVSMVRFGVAARDTERARQFEQAHDRCLAEGRETLASLERAARFRHDQRNHLQVLDGLLARGEREDAAAYVRGLRAELERGEKQ